MSDDKKLEDLLPDVDPEEVARQRAVAFDRAQSMARDAELRRVAQERRRAEEEGNVLPSDRTEYIQPTTVPPSVHIRQTATKVKIGELPDPRQLKTRRGLRSPSAGGGIVKEEPRPHDIIGDQGSIATTDDGGTAASPRLPLVPAQRMVWLFVGVVPAVLLAVWLLWPSSSPSPAASSPVGAAPSADVAASGSPDPPPAASLPSGASDEPVLKAAAPESSPPVRAPTASGTRPRSTAQPSMTSTAAAATAQPPALPPSKPTSDRLFGRDR